MSGIADFFRENAILQLKTNRVNNKQITFIGLSKYTGLSIQRLVNLQDQVLELFMLFDTEFDLLWKIFNTVLQNSKLIICR